MDGIRQEANLAMMMAEGSFPMIKESRDVKDNG